MLNFVIYIASFSYPYQKLQKKEQNFYININLKIPRVFYLKYPGTSLNININLQRQT